MVLTMKLTTFAWNVYDGRRKAEVSVAPQCLELALEIQTVYSQDLDKWQTEKRVVHYPSLLEFLGYS